jgi:hypothetical protein
LGKTADIYDCRLLSQLSPRIRFRICLMTAWVETFLRTAKKRQRFCRMDSSPVASPEARPPNVPDVISSLTQTTQEKFVKFFTI